MLCDIPDRKPDQAGELLSGDVLAGIIAGLGAGEEILLASRAGVFLHGLSGERAQARYGERSMLAGGAG